MWNDLSKDKQDEITKLIIGEINQADEFYQNEIELKLIERHQLYESDPAYYKKKYPKLTEITTVAASDVQDTIEWAMPSLMRIFFGTDDIIKLQGVTEASDPAAQAMQDLIQYQLERHNSAYLTFHDWFKSALVDNLGVLKAYWEREENVESFVVTCGPDDLANMQANPKVNITKQEEVSPGVFQVEYDELTSLIRNQPKIETLLPNEFRYDPKAKTLDEADFVAHRKVVTADYLRRRVDEGVYDEKLVEDVIENGGRGDTRTDFENTLNPNAHNYKTESETEEAKKEFVLYECYWKTDVDDDGRLEDVIVTVVEEKVVRLDENPMGRHPFFTLSPIRDPIRVWAKRGISDLVGELQDLNTALLKQIIYNIAVNNDKQAFINIDVMLDPNEFTNGEKAVRVTGDPKQAVYWMPIEPLPPQVFSFIEMIQGMKENRTGITRYNQGLQADSLNKTAHGIQAIMSASTQRLELVARMFAETGIKQLFRYLIQMNQSYIDEPTFVRITGQQKTINPDDLQGEIDTVVNAGIAVGTKEAQAQNLQQLLAMYQQAIPAGMAGVQHAAYAFGRLVENMGYKNTKDFCYKPEEVVQMQQAAAQAAQNKPPETKLSESIAVKLEGLPIPTQIKVLNMMGIPATMDDFLQHAALMAHQQNFMSHVIGGTNDTGTNGNGQTGDGVSGGIGPGLPGSMVPPAPGTTPPAVEGLPTGGTSVSAGTY